VPCIGSVGRAGRAASAPPVRRSDPDQRLALQAQSQCCPSSGWCVPPRPGSKEEDGGPARPRRSSPSASTPTPPPRLTSPANCSAPAQSLPPLPATLRCLPGRPRWDAWTGSAWGAPAATAPGSRVGCAPTGQSVQEVAARPGRPTAPGQARHPARPRGRPSSAGRDGHGDPKAADGQVEMIRSPHLARRSAVKARTHRQPAQRAAGDRARWATGPASRPAAGRSGRHRSPAAARPGARHADDTARFALRSVASRWLRLTEEITELDVQLERLVFDQVADDGGVVATCYAGCVPSGRGQRRHPRL
jgi:hypothetical protein